MVRGVDIMWPFFQKTMPTGFEKICDNDKLGLFQMYLLRDRRDGFEKNDYIGTYWARDGITFSFFIERFFIHFYKTSQETNWTKMAKLTFFNNVKYNFLDSLGNFQVPKKFINNCSLDPEKSITIYNLFEIQSPSAYDFYNTVNIKQYITDTIKDAIKAKPSLVKELPADLLPVDLLQPLVGGRIRRRRLTKHHKKHSIKTRKMLP